MPPLKNLDTRAKTVSFILPDLSGGGAERVQLNLANEFMARGHPVEFVLLRAEGDLIPWLSAETGLVDMKSKQLRNALLPLARYLRKRRPDACLAAMWPLTSLAMWARDLARVPTQLVLSDHTDFMAAPETASAFNRWKLRHTMRWTYPRADGVVAVSGGAAGSLATLTGMAPERISVIHNPIRPPSSGETGQPCIAAAAWAAHRGPRVIAVGSLKPAKNFALLLAAFAKVRQHSNARLLILGEGPLRDELETLKSRLGLGGAVDMPGFVGNPYSYLARADVLVLSSAWEGFGNVIVEALACGTKVVSTDCRSGPREILADGRYGMLVAPGDAAALAEAILAGLAADYDRAVLIRRSQDFSVAKAAEQYLELLFPRASSKDPSCLKSK